MLCRHSRSSASPHRLLLPLTLLALCLAWSCIPSRGDIRNLTVNGGTPLVSFLRGPSQVLLLLSPEDLFACTNHVYRWLEWDRDTSGDLVIAFVREPSVVEARQLTALRVDDYVTLDPDPLVDQLARPAEFLVQRDTLRFWEFVEIGAIGSRLSAYLIDGTRSTLPQQTPLALPP